MLFKVPKLLPQWNVCNCVFFFLFPIIRSQSVVEAGTLKHEEKGENENTQPLLALDWTPSHPTLLHIASLQWHQPPGKHGRTDSHRHVHSAWHKTLHSRHPAMTVTSHWSEQPKWNKDLRDVFVFVFVFPSSARGLEDEARQLWSKAGFSLPP